MKITALTRQRRTGRVNVFLDDEFWLGLSAETLVRLGLYKGQEVSTEEREQIEAEAGQTKWFDRAVRYLSYRPRSEQEVRKKLHQLGATTEEAEETLQRLRGLDLVDDREFVAAYLRDRDAVRPYGADRLRQELVRRGVGRELIDELLEERDPEADFSQALALAQRDPLWGRRAERAVQSKLYGRLRRRGYPSELIRRILDA